MIRDGNTEGTNKPVRILTNNGDSLLGLAIQHDAGVRMCP